MRPKSSKSKTPAKANPHAYANTDSNSHAHTDPTAVVSNGCGDREPSGGGNAA